MILIRKVNDEDGYLGRLWNRTPTSLHRKCFPLQWHIEQRTCQAPEASLGPLTKR